jgi:hypothetical protein
MLKDEIEKKIKKKNYTSQFRLTCQTRDLDHDTRINP